MVNWREYSKMKIRPSLYGNRTEKRKQIQCSLTPSYSKDNSFEKIEWSNLFIRDQFSWISWDTHTDTFTFTNIWHSILSYIVMQQTRYPWNYIPTNQRNFENPLTLARTNKTDYTITDLNKIFALSASWHRRECFSDLFYHFSWESEIVIWNKTFPTKLFLQKMWLSIWSFHRKRIGTSTSLF